MKGYPMQVVDRVFLIVQAVVSAALVGMVMLLDVLPTHYLLALPLLLVIFLMLSFLMLWRHKSRIAGRILSGLLSVIMALGSFYVWKTHDVLGEISGANSKVDDISVIVLESDLAQGLEDAREYRFGVQTAMDRPNTEQAIAEIETKLGTTLNTSEYLSIDKQVDGLYHGEVQALILNEAYRAMVEESYEKFSTETRVISTHKYETEVSINKTGGNITEEPFTVYISGIDVYGQIATTSRTDVNILATINPKTRQILLTTTPRDYFVELPFAGNARDKLTHTGIYGVDASIETLEYLYGIEIDYYARVNFTSVENIVNALGGITVNSEKSFTTVEKTGGYSFTEGRNTMDGAQALAFARERKAFEAGDVQRGRNQMAVIKGIIDKAISPTIIGNYVGLLDSMGDSLETNMSTAEITSLVKMQMRDNTGWEIISSNVIGVGSYSSTYSMSQQLWVMLPDEASVVAAKERIAKINAGEVLPPVDVASPEAEGSLPSANQTADQME